MNLSTKMKVTYYGHFTFLIETQGQKLLFDPYILDNPLNKNFDLSSISVDYIILSHGHGDHCADVMEIYKHNSNATLIAMYEITDWFQKQGVQSVHPMNIGGKKSFDFGTLKMVNAVHSSMLPDGSYGGNPCGFLIQNDEASFYFSGDTALHQDMKLMPLWAPKLDFAIMPIGDNFTMGYEDACIAADFVQTDRIIGAHFDTFGFIEIDKEKAKHHFKENGKELVLIDINHSINI
jgi:L-ascorbate metabolism protein UlaG (beta-lactamase superfamily)